MTTFVHTIGGYYKDRKKFIKEARQTGVNRRIAVHLLRKFNFGDVVLCLDWNGGQPVAYGEFTVTRLSFQAEVMDRVAHKVIEDGEGEYQEGIGPVIRECGSYMDTGGVVLHEDSKLTLADVLARGKAVAEELGIKKLETFIGGTFRAYQEPFELDRKPPFQMGYWEWEDHDIRRRGGKERAATGIGDYYLRTRVGRADPVVARTSEEVTPTIS